MTSDTFRSHRVPPVDLVLHALQDALGKRIEELAKDIDSNVNAMLLGEGDATEGDRAMIDGLRLATLACAITRAINPGALASSWAADGDADIAGAHLARRLADPGPDDGDLRPVSTAEGRALETAVARRLADTACSLAITGDKEDAAQASALWEASATLTGLHGLSYELRHDPTLKQELDAAIAATEKAIKERDEARVGWVEARWGRYWGGNIKGDNDAVPVKPRILQSADEAPCGSLMQTTEGQFEGRLVMRYLDGIGCGVPKANYWEDDSWEWEPFNTEHDFPARLIAEGLTETECRHLSGLSAADAIAWCERRAAHAALAEGVRAKVGHAFEVKPAAPIKDPRLEVPGALLDDLRTEAGEHSIDAETIVRSAVREIKRRRAAMDILTAKRAEAESDVANWRTWALAGQRAAKDEAHAAIEARAQMQARLVAVERERDAAQEEAKALRVVVANKMSESMLAIMEGIAKGPTMEWRNGKP